MSAFIAIERGVSKAAAVGLLLGVIWFIPDPERMHRLRELLAGIPPGELGLRDRLGR